MCMNALLFYINCVLLLANVGDFAGIYIISCTKEYIAICNFVQAACMIMNLIYKTCIRFVVIEGIQAFSFELSVRPALTLKL